MLNILKFVGKVLFITTIVIVSIYLIFTAYAALDYFNIGADNS